MRYAKKLTAFFVALLLLLTYLATCFLRVSAAMPSVNVAVYDNSVSSSYKVSWSTVTLPQATTPEILLNSLKAQGQITDYVVAQGQISSITFGTETLAADDVSSWSCYINGKSGSFDTALSADDAVVFSYQQPGSQPPSFSPPEASQPESSSAPASSHSSSVGQGQSQVPSSSQQPPSSSPAQSVPDQPSSDSKAAQSVLDSTTGSASSNALFQWTPEMTISLENANKWISLNEKGDYYLIAAGIAGQTVDATSFTRMKQSILSQKGEYSSATKLAQDIFSVLFSGLNPEDFYGLNLLQALYNFPELTSQRIYAISYTLMVYDSNSYKIPENAVNPREKLIESLLTFQNQDGGFSLSPRGDSDIGTTATAVIALSNYLERDDVKRAVRNALGFFQEHQTQDGSFTVSGNPNSQDLSNVIVALSSLGISAEDERFVKGKQTGGQPAKTSVNVVDALLSYQQPDGGFALTKGNSSSVSATEQAVIALSAAQRQINPFVLQNSMDYQASGQPEGQDKAKGRMVELIILIGSLVLIAGAAALVMCCLRKRHTLTGEDDEPPES